jgi:hypothetical protein
VVALILPVKASSILYKRSGRIVYPLSLLYCLFYFNTIFG